MRSRSPFGNPVLWIVAAFVLPEVVKKCKPFAKVVGDTLVSAGEAFRKAAEEKPATIVAEPPAAHVEVPVAEAPVPEPTFETPEEHLEGPLEFDPEA